MRRFFKVKNFFLISFLAVAGIFSAGAFALNKQTEETPVVEKAEAATKSTNVFLPGDWHSSWTEDDTSKMYYYGQSGSNYVYYLNFTTTKAYQGFKVHDKEHNDSWVSTLGGSSGNTLQVSGYTGNVELKNGVYGTYVLTYCYKSSSEKWIDNCVSATNWLTLTKKYSINGSDGGSAGSNQSLDFGASLSGITNPTGKTGYTFGGWYWDVACNSAVSSSGVADGWSSSSGQSATIYAKMIPSTTTVSLNAQGGIGGSSSVTATYGVAMPSITLPTKEGYIFGGYWTSSGGSGTKYYNNDGSSAKNWDKTSATSTLHAYWTEATYIIKLKFVIDGNEQTQWTGQTISDSGPHTFSEYESDETWLDFAYGYTFEGFYATLSGGKLYDSLSSSYLSAAPWTGGSQGSGDQYAYAKYVRNPTNKTYYAYFDNCSAIETGQAYALYYKKSGDDVIATSGFPGTKLISHPTISHLYSFSIPNDATGIVLNNNHEGTAQCQTIDFYIGEGESYQYSNGKNMIIVNTNYGGANQGGYWSDVVYSLLIGTDATGWNYITMTEPTDSSGNQAELRHVTVSNGIEFKAKMIFTGVGAGEYWYGHVYKDATNPYSFMDWTKTNQYSGSSSTSDGYSNGAFASNLGTHLSYSFYLSGGIIYIVDDANETDCGYLYVASNVESNHIKATVTTSASNEPYTGEIISNITGTETAVSVHFNGYTYLHKISMYNLRGSDDAHYVTNLVLTDGTTTTTYTWASSTSGNPSIYIVLGSASKDSTNVGPAASLAFKIDDAINDENNTKKSVCSFTQAQAAAFVTSYTGLTQTGKIAFDNSTVTTWADSSRTGTTTWSMLAVRREIESIATNGKPAGYLNTNILFGVGDTNENKTVLVIIIASSISLLSITALSVLLVKKRKAKQD